MMTTLLNLVIRAALFLFVMWGAESSVFAYSANFVKLEKYENIHRVLINYTIPQLGEFREAIIEFRDPKKAHDFYLDVVSGAEFYINEEKQLEFTAPQVKPLPW